MRMIGCGSVAADGTVVVASEVATPAKTATGVYTLTLADMYQADATQCTIFCQERGVMAASGMSSFGSVHTSDTVKTIHALREGAAGAASALTDIAFDWFIFSTLPALLK